MGLAQINIKFTADLRGFSTEMQNSIRRIGQMGKELQTAGRGLSTYLTLPLLAAGAAAIKFASDYQESVNKVDVAFGEASGSVKEFAKTSLENFGIAEGSALDMAATYGDMATGLGLSQKQAAAMSKQLVGLGGDLASFKNISIDIANTALKSIFTGETESLKQLGIVMTEANLQAYAFSQGIRKKMKDMSQAEKVALRYNYVLSVTKNAQGDFARTGGGASNQMRIFQESLKQVGQQLGSVILPLFTRMITYVNGMIKSFSGLSNETKTTIVVVGGIVAAIGPLLTVIGSLLTLVPNVITKFNALKDAWKGITAVLAANPFTAIAVALAAIIAYSLIANSRFTSLTNSTKEFESINSKAADSIAKESAELNKNIAIAKNEVYSKEARLEAIKNINSQSPEYLGNITLENIYTEKTTNAVKAYTAALLNKAKVHAAEEKLVEVQKQLLNLQLGIIDAVKPSVWQNLGNAMLAAGNSANFAARTSQTVAKNYGIEHSELLKLQAVLTNFIATNKGYKDSNDEVNLSLEKTIKNQSELRAGTIAFYEKQIQDLQKLQKEQAITHAGWLVYQKDIDNIQKKIDQLEGTSGVKLPKPELPNEEEVFTPSFSLEELKSQLNYYEQLRDRYSKTSADYIYYSDQVSNTKLKIAGIEGVDEFDSSLTATQERLLKFNDSIKEAFNATLVSFAEGFGEIIAKFVEGGVSLKGIGKMIFSTLGDLAIQVGKIAVSTGMAVLGIKKALQSLNPYVAIGAGIALIALGTLVKSQLGNIGAFADGGIVGGSSFYGDKILARVNSGELILNEKQQRNVYHMLNNGDSGSGMFIPDIRISGEDLLIVFGRAQANKNRRG